MKLSPLILLLGLGLTGCKKDSDSAYPDSVIGSWQLVSRACFCAPRVSSPQESLTLKQGQFTFYKDGQPVSTGTYTFYTIDGASSCNANESVLLFTYKPGSQPYAANGASYSLAGDKLILDYGGCLDAPADTYRRLP